MVVIPVVASVAQAKSMTRIGVDAIVAEGMEAGGHIGQLTTMTLVKSLTLWICLLLRPVVSLMEKVWQLALCWVLRSSSWHTFYRSQRIKCPPKL